MARKKNYKLKDFCGIDARDGGLIKNSLSYAENLIPSNGVLTKRKGWRVIDTFLDQERKPLKINGIFEYEGDLIIHAGTELYRASYDLSRKEKIYLEPSPLSDARSQAFVNDGLLFICSGGALLIYDGEGLHSAYEYNSPYIPTTSVGVPELDYVSEDTSNESPNILTAKRINFLRGKRLDGVNHIFRLDAPPRLGTPFTATVQIRVQRVDVETSDVYSGYIGLDKKDNGYNGVLTAVMHTNSLSQESIPSADLVAENGEIIRLKGNVNVACSVKGDLLTVYFNCPTPWENRDNIKIEFEADTADHLILKEIAHFCPCTRENGKNLLLLSTGDNRLIYTHSSGDLFYMPSENVLSIGRSAQGITAILPMADNYACVYKRDSLYRVQIGEEAATVFSSEDTEGCISPFASARLNGDCLTLGSDGVYGILELDSTKGIITRLSQRSASIAALLSKHTSKERDKACM